MVVLVWNTYPKEFCKLWPILLRCYSMKVKISKDCKYEIQKRKEEVNSWHVIYLVILVGTKLPLVHVVETLHTRVLLLGNQVSPKSFTCHKGSSWRHSSSSIGHLDTACTKELLHQGRGSTRLLHKVSSLLHTKLEGQRLLRRPQGFQCTLQLDSLENHFTRLAHLAYNSDLR
jgi:hypothetical protein